MTDAANPLLGFIPLVVIVAIVIPPFWMIFGKAGFSKWLSLLMFIPIVNLIVLYFVAFSRWPNTSSRKRHTP